MANGSIETIIGEVHLPITFSGITHIMDVKIIRGLADTCVWAWTSEKFSELSCICATGSYGWLTSQL